MVRRGNLKILVTLVLVVLLWGKKAQAVPSSIFDFNDGTVQGWTLEGAFDPEIYDITFTSNFSNGWSDSSNYPKVPGLDPVLLGIARCGWSSAVGGWRPLGTFSTPGRHGVPQADPLTAFSPRVASSRGPAGPSLPEEPAKSSWRGARTGSWSPMAREMTV